MAQATARLTLMMEPDAGRDAVLYDLDISPDAWCLNTDGSSPFATSDDWPEVKVYKTTGSDREDITASLRSTLTSGGLTLSCKLDGASAFLQWSGSVCRINPTILITGKGAREARVTLSGKDVQGNTITFAAKNCAISIPGASGGLRPPTRWTNWDTDPMGMKFYSGDSSSDEFTDMVYIVRTNADGTVTSAFGKCIRNFTREVGDTGKHFIEVLRDGSNCFKAFSHYDFLATEILWALVGKIGEFIFENGRMLSQSQTIDGTPNVILDGVTGMGWFTGSIINPFRRINKTNLREFITKSGEDALFDLQKSGLKIMFDLTNTELNEALFEDAEYFGTSVTMPSSVEYAGVEFEVYNCRGNTLGLFTGNFLTRPWENFNPLTQSFTTPVLQPYTYYKWRCMAFRTVDYMDTPISGRPSDSGFLMCWVLIEEKKLK